MTMRRTLISYTPYERTTVESLLETYIQVVILAANSQKESNLTLTLLTSSSSDPLAPYRKQLKR